MTPSSFFKIISNINDFVLKGNRSLYKLAVVACVKGEGGGKGTEG